MLDDNIVKKIHEIDIEILDEFARICLKHNLRYFLVGGTLLGAARHKGFIPWDDDIDVGMPRNDYERFMAICKTELKKDFYCQSALTDKTFWLLFSKLRKNNTHLNELNGLLYSQNDHSGIFIDIFPYDNCTNNIAVLKFQYKLMKKVENIINLKRQSWMPPQYAFTFFKKIIYSLIPYGVLQTCRRKIMMVSGKRNEYIISWGGIYPLEKEVFKNEDFFPSSQLEFEGRSYTVPGNWKKYLAQIYGDYMQLPPEKDRTVHTVTACFDTNGNTDQ